MSATLKRRLHYSNAFPLKKRILDASQANEYEFLPYTFLMTFSGNFIDRLSIQLQGWGENYGV